MQSEKQQQAMNLIALLCLMYHLSPADLEAIAHQQAPEFDDDIPFAPIGLQYPNHAIYAL